MSNDYFTMIDDKWCVNVPELELIIHEENLIGDREEKEVFGFGCTVVSYDGQGNKKEQKSLVMATVFFSKPVQMEYNKDEEQYHLHYDMEHQESHPFMVSKNTIKDITNVERLFDLLSKGKVTNKIDRSDYIDVVLNNIYLNKRLDISDRDVEIMLGEYLRDGQNPKVPARVTGNSDYQVLSYRNLVAQQSTWTAISHEDPDTMLSVSLTRDEEDETSSPLEKYSQM